MQTGAISDAMDQLGLPNGTITGLIGVANAAGESTGTVRTATVVDTAEPGIPGLTELLDSLVDGDVLVLGWRADATASTFGDLAATRAVRAGCRALVCGGWVRDVPDLRATGLPVWARGATPRSGKGRLAVVDVDRPATVGDVTTHRGDLAIVDETGVCVVPDAHRRAVLALATDLLRKDDTFRQVLAGGGSFAGGVDVAGTM
jgi:4-hydroxy-4-methyl-2-oxoglutarate aldolase